MLSVKACVEMHERVIHFWWELLSVLYVLDERRKLSEFGRHKCINYYWMFCYWCAHLHNLTILQSSTFKLKLAAVPICPCAHYKSYEWKDPGQSRTPWRTHTHTHTQCLPTLRATRSATAALVSRQCEKKVWIAETRELLKLQKSYRKLKVR